jgi:hypothetical protein
VTLNAGLAVAVAALGAFAMVLGVKIIWLNRKNPGARCHPGRG